MTIEYADSHKSLRKIVGLPNRGDENKRRDGSKRWMVLVIDWYLYRRADLVETEAFAGHRTVGSNSSDRGRGRAFQNRAGGGPLLPNPRVSSERSSLPPSLGSRPLARALEPVCPDLRPLPPRRLHVSLADHSARMSAPPACRRPAVPSSVLSFCNLSYILLVFFYRSSRFCGIIARATVLHGRVR